MSTNCVDIAFIYWWALQVNQCFIYFIKGKNLSKQPNTFIAVTKHPWELPHRTWVSNRYMPIDGQLYMPIDGLLFELKLI